MKKSLQEAMETARAMSKEHPEITYHVMDKSGCGQTATQNELILINPFTAIVITAR